MADKDGNKTGGRQPGTPNKATQEAKEIAERLKFSPFEILAHYAMRNHEALGLPEYSEKVTKTGAVIEVLTISPELSQKSAKDAAEFVLPKLKSIEHKGPNGVDLFAKLLDEIDGSK
jgi:hypothetical protein